ncbi:MAG: AAA family ATPase [Treponema sp.]|nr:AAA family ATPase [Treponema sp.]
MAERSLRIEAFRNIGFKDGKPWHERLVLNNSLKKGELGDLLILIGANNSGKSNLLDALNIFCNGNISERDVTDLPFGDDCKKPTLTLFSRKDGDKEDEFSYTKKFNEQNRAKVMGETPYKFQYLTKENILSDLDKLSDTESTNLDNEELQELWDSYTDEGEQPEKEISDDDFKILPQKIFDILSSYEECQKKIKEDWNRTRYSQYQLELHRFNNFFGQISETEVFKEFTDYKNFKQQDCTTILNTTYGEEYNYNFIPKIYVYEQAEISNNDLKTDYDSVEKSDFFTAVFNSIDVDVSEVLNAHKQFSQNGNMGILQRITKQLNKKLKAIAAKFNKLYYLENAPYSLEVDLQESSIYFYLNRGDNTIYLDYQSAGFRWFFNIFFNLLNTTELNAGDIIIMDEPAMNLHVKGQRELRAFLKEFTIQNDITIIVATHSPFLIDLDYLDELCVVVNDGTVSHIVNNFAAVDPNDPDSLLPIKDALTVENHILVDPDEKIIFVEGITDYNYLTAFKKLFGKTGITFLPINGVGENLEDCKKISKKLLRIRKHDPILLVDNDKAGQQMKNVNKESELEVIALSDIDSNFKTIESLFSQEDLNTFGLLDENGKFVKHASTSTVFKNMILKNKDSISDNTKANFRKVFDWLVDEA